MITGTISASDYLNAQRLHYARAVRWYYFVTVITSVIGLIVYFMVNRHIGLIVACAGVGGAVGKLITATFYLPRKVRRLHSQQKDFTYPFTYKWDSTFLEGQGVSGHSKREWSNYSKWKEDEKIFLLYHADNLFEMFPKSWFRDQTQISEFRQLANRAGKT